MSFLDFAALKQRVSYRADYSLCSEDTGPTSSQFRAACPNCNEAGIGLSLSVPRRRMGRFIDPPQPQPHANALPRLLE
jgi:hypothetical protein